MTDGWATAWNNPLCVWLHNETTTHYKLFSKFYLAHWIHCSMHIVTYDRVRLNISQWNGYLNRLQIYNDFCTLFAEINDWESIIERLRENWKSFVGRVSNFFCLSLQIKAKISLAEKQFCIINKICKSSNNQLLFYLCTYNKIEPGSRWKIQQRREFFSKRLYL